MAVPTSLQFKGELNRVENLLLTAQAVRERRLTPEAKTSLASQPGGIRSHFWAEPYRFALMQYQQGQVAIRVR